MPNHAVSNQGWRVNLARLIKILNEFTYSSPRVAIRELISNAADSITERVELDRRFSENDGEIRVRIKDDSYLVIEDNGAGISPSDLEDVFGTVASSTKEDLRERFGRDIRQPIIGTLGIGRLAAFLIADEMTVESTHWKQGSATCLWRGNEASFSIEEKHRGSIGTCITLRIKDTQSEFLVERSLKRYIRDFSRNIFYPIYLGEEPRPINQQKAPWYETAQKPDNYEERVRSYLAEVSREFAHLKDANNPIACIPLWIEEPVVLKGVLYVPRDLNEFIKRGAVAEGYCRGVLISEDLPLLPSEASFVRGIVESPDFTLTVNRQGLVHDGNFVRVQESIRQQVIDYMRELAMSDDRQDSGKLSYILSMHRNSIVRGAVETNDSDYFSAMVRWVMFQSNNPKETPTSLPAYRLRLRPRAPIRYIMRASGATHFERLTREKYGEVLVAENEVEAGFVKKFAKLENIGCEPVDDLAETLLQDLHGEQPKGLGWSRIVSYFLEKLDHPEFLLQLRFCDLQDDDVNAMVLPDPQESTKSFLDSISEDLADKTRDPEQRAAIQSKLQQIGGRRTLYLCLNTSSETLNGLATMQESETAENRLLDVMLHEIFHHALTNADIPIPLHHLREVHARAMQQLSSQLLQSRQTSDSPRKSAEPSLGSKAVASVDMSQYGRFAETLEQMLNVEQVLRFSQEIQKLINKSLADVSSDLQDRTLMIGTGDGALLVFERSHEAVCFAQMLQKMAQQINRGAESQNQKHFRIGVAYGDVVIHEEDSRSGSASSHIMAGSPVIRAVRLQQACQPGSILIDDEAWAELPREDADCDAARGAYNDVVQVSGKDHEGLNIGARRRVIYTV